MNWRATTVAGLLVMGACTQGTSGWLLQERAASGGSSALAGEGGEAENAGAAGQSTAAGASGEAGDNGAAPLRCPSRFSAQCSPTIVYDNRDQMGSGALFEKAIPDLATTLPCTTRDVCDILYRKSAEIKKITQITVLIEAFDGISETYGSNGESVIHLSSTYMQSVVDAGGDLTTELRGLFYFHGANIYQFDGGNYDANAWVIRGVADYVRYTGGLLPLSERMPGGKYTDGDATTGFFLAYLDQQYPDFVYELNLSLNPATTTMWSTQSFMDITGKSVDTLWTAYQKTL